MIEEVVVETELPKVTMHALIARGEGAASILTSKGAAWSSLLDRGRRLYDMEIPTPPTPGLWMWEGWMCWGERTGRRYKSWPEGVYRRLTDEEVARFIRGEDVVPAVAPEFGFRPGEGPDEEIARLEEQLDIQLEALVRTRRALQTARRDAPFTRADFQPDSSTLVVHTRLHDGIKDACERQGIVTFGDLSEWSRTSLLRLRGIGKAFVLDIESQLTRAGLELRKDPLPETTFSYLHGDKDLTKLIETFARGAGCQTLADLAKQDFRKAETMLRSDIVKAERLLWRAGLEFYRAPMTPGEPAMPVLDEAERAKILAQEINRDSLSVRTENALRATGAVTYGDLVKLRESTLLRLKHFGRKSLTEIRQHLAVLGLSLASE